MFFPVEYSDEYSTALKQVVFAMAEDAKGSPRTPERSELKRIWWRRVDSNHGPTDYETVALAT
jgi:hypothetical protein